MILPAITQPQHAPLALCANCRQGPYPANAVSEVCKHTMIPGMRTALIGQSLAVIRAYGYGYNLNYAHRAQGSDKRHMGDVVIGRDSNDDDDPPFDVRAAIS